MSDLLVVVVLGWIASGIVGGVIGARRNSASAGFALGVLFGPLGAIAAFALDGRFACPSCRNKIDTGVRICPTCHAELAWFAGVVDTVENAEEWRATRQQELEAQRVKEQRLIEDAERQREEFLKKLVALLLWIRTGIVSLARIGFRVVSSPLVAMNGVLLAMSEGSATAYRILWFGWFVLIPATLLVAIGIVVAASRSPLAPAPSPETANAED